MKQQQVKTKYKREPKNTKNTKNRKNKNAN